MLHALWTLPIWYYFWMFDPCARVNTFYWDIASYWKISIFHDFMAEYNVEFGKHAITAQKKVWMCKMREFIFDAWMDDSIPCYVVHIWKRVYKRPFSSRAVSRCHTQCWLSCHCSTLEMHTKNIIKVLVNMEHGLLSWFT